jgi:hypothetical protein
MEDDMLLLIAVCITGITLAFIGLVAHDLQLQRQIMEMKRTWKPRSHGVLSTMHYIDDDGDMEAA